MGGMADRLPTNGPPRRGPVERAWRAVHRGESTSWLTCTILQALLTWGFIGLSRLSRGWLWEPQAKLLVVMAIVATWCLALRTIRARIVELLRFLRLMLARTPGRPAEAAGPRGERRRAGQVTYVRKSMLWLRITAAGITMPFFILPVCVSAVCLALCWQQDSPPADLLGLALLLSVLAAIVAAYFHWSIVPAPSPAGKNRPG